MTHERLIKMLEKQLKLEKEAAIALRREMKGIDHLGIKVLFEVCAADSVKHANIVRLMLDNLQKGELSRDTFSSTWRQRHEGLEAIKNHIQREKDMIELLKDEVVATEDKVLKALLKHILADEERHHKILKKEIWEI